MDFEAVRTFVTVAEHGRFQTAADELGLTQQAVSKRVAGLERDLGVALFARNPRGAVLSADGSAFLPHARAVLKAVERAAAAVRPGGRALRVDVLNRRFSCALALREFFGAHPGARLEVVTLPDANTARAVEAVAAGEIDATFRAVAPGDLAEGVTAVRVLDDPLQLLAGPEHALARARSVRPDQLRGHRLWIPGLRAGTEWSAFYDDLATAFGLRIDAAGPNFGSDALMDALAADPTLATLVGAGDLHLWPAGHDLRRVPITDPAPVYPHALVFRADDPHPTLAALLGHLARTRPPVAGHTWTPAWASRQPRTGS
ncbi:LysR family transcriptional regulator [Nocardia farcinica]|uniref:LysR family transcriptional regulator n=1 Tax=Nocardia farcinica TaxID=37329 RepID=UPI0024578995|nr:LysR family transcriptional regulator [Nocardia farcinica]